MAVDGSEVIAMSWNRWLHRQAVGEATIGRAKSLAGSLLAQVVRLIALVRAYLFRLILGQVVALLHGFLEPDPLGVQVLFVGSGVSVEITSFVVVVFLDVHEARRTLGHPLEAGEARHAAVRVDVDVLHVRSLHSSLELLLLFLYLFAEHLKFLLVFLDAHLDAVDEHFSVNDAF